MTILGFWNRQWKDRAEVIYQGRMRAQKDKFSGLQG